MTAGTATGLVLDTGALLALERTGRRVGVWIEGAQARGQSIIVPAGCVAQAWRGGPQQARLARLLRHPSTVVADLDHESARRVGELLAATGSADAIDGHVALVAIRSGAAVLTSDPQDIRTLAPRTDVIPV